MPESEQVPPTKPTEAPKPPKSPVPPTSGPLAALEAKFYEWFVYKAPYQFPASVTDVLVKVAPWIILVLAIILVPFAITTISGALFVANLVTIYGGGVAAQPTFMLWLSVAILIAQVVIMFVSVPKLLKFQRSGWLLVFYAGLINIAYGLFASLSYGYFAIGSLIWALISAAIGLYVLFQIRRYYTK